MKSIKNLSSVISRPIRVLILVLLIAYVIVSGFGNYNGILDAFRALAPLGLIVAGILFLELNGKELAAHAALLIGFFLSAGTNFINSLLSLRFEPFGLANPLSVDSFVELFAFIYLALMVFSFFFSAKEKTNKNDRKDLVVTSIIAFIFFYLRSGLFVAISKLLLPVISLLFGLPLATIFFLAAGVIDVPFDFIDTILNTNLLSIPISYYLFSLFAFYLIFGAVKGILGELKK